MSGSTGERPTPDSEAAAASGEAADRSPARATETGESEPATALDALSALEADRATESEPASEPVPESAPGSSASESASETDSATAAAETSAAKEEPLAATPAGDESAAKEEPPAATPAGDESAGEEESPAEDERPEMRAVREALAKREPLEGRVIGWNNGGFHLALGELAAFCPRSEMEVGEAQAPESYLDKTFLFRILRLQGKGRRIVVSRAAQLRAEKSRQRAQIRKKLQPGAVLDGTVSSLTDFGAFVDLGGTQGLVHVSEISHQRVEHPGAVLSEGQQIRVKVLKVEKGGRRISLSMRALEADPWKELVDRFPRGAVVKGKVEKATSVGAFIELAPGLTGLLPVKSMAIPRETNPARAYPPGKEVSVQILSIDPRRQRISLALEGSTLEGSRSDYQEYQRRRRQEAEGEGFNALASAFRRLQDDAD